MTHRFTRKQLYALVWAEPMQKLAPKLGISDVGLAKTCRGADIPVPERGYWAKLQAGKSVTQPALPSRPLGMLDEVHIGPSAPRSPFEEEEIPDEPPQPPSFAEPIPEMIERVRKMVGEVTSAKNLDNPHPAIAKLLQTDERRRQKQRESAYPSIWDSAVFDSPLERRRLRILSSVFVALSRSGAEPWLRGREGRELGVLVGSIQISFLLDRPEHDARQQRYSSRASDDPRATGPLRLRLENSCWWKPDPVLQWQDTDDLKLEGVLDEVVVRILASGEITLREWVQYQYEEDLKRRAELLEKARSKKEEDERKERERIARLEQDRVEQLMKDAASWHRAGEIRAFVRARVDAVSIRAMDDKIRSALEEWRTWALGIADQMDPLSRM